MKKTLSLLLAVLMLMTVLVGCNEGQTPPSEQGNTTPVETTTAIETPEDTTAAILLADLAKYTVVRPENANDKVLDATSKIVKAMEQIYSVRLTPRDDFFRDDVPSLAMGEFEILIGPTNREESIEFLSELKTNDFGFRIIGKKLVIAGHTDDTTVAAVDDFILSCMSSSGENFFSNEKAYIKRAEYLLDELKLGGVSVKDYRIVFPYRPKNNEDIAAGKIKNLIADISGYVVEIVDDREEAVEKEIMVGNVSHLSDALKSASPEIKNNDYYVAREDNDLWLTAANTAGFIAAAKSFGDALMPKNGETELDAEIKLGLSENVASDELTTMSFNVWVSQKTDQRSKAVVDMILKYLPDTVGVQEASPAWMTTLKNGIGSLYDCVGEGRNGGNKGEYSAVFYLKEKFTLKESATKWLSATPDVADSKFASSSLPRIMTYALLERKSDGQLFAHVNTHLEHTSENAREEQVAVLLEQIKPLLKYPIVMTGDFNAQSSSNVYKDVTSAIFADAAKIAEKAENKATFPGSNKIIDFIFVTKSSIIVDTYDVCDENMNGMQPSDHYPIFAKCFIVG